MVQLPWKTVSHFLEKPSCSYHMTHCWECNTHAQLSMTEMGPWSKIGRLYWGWYFGFDVVWWFCTLLALRATGRNVYGIALYSFLSLHANLPWSHWNISIWTMCDVEFANCIDIVLARFLPFYPFVAFKS